MTKENKLKESFELIQLPEDAKDRITANCVNSSKSHTKHTSVRLMAIAAAAAMLSISVFAVGSRIFYHDKAYQDKGQIPNTNNGVSFTGPNESARVGTPLEEHDFTFKARTWNTDEYLGGGTGHRNWQSMKVLTAQGPLRSRNIFAEDGAVKTEYSAKDLTSFKDVPFQHISADFAGLAQQYHFVPDSSYGWTIQDHRGRNDGECFLAACAGTQPGSWFNLSVEYDPNFEYSNTSYFQEGVYDQSYFYSSSDGYVFLIQTFGDSIWANCSTEHANFSLYGNFVSTSEVEDFLDHLGLKMAD